MRIWTPDRPAEALALVARVAGLAEAEDGIGPFSDDTRLALTAGRRTTVAIGDGDRAVDAHAPSALGAAVVGDGELELCIVPEARGRGLGSALLRQALARETGPLESWAHGAHPAAAVLAAANGFDPVRTLFLLRRAVEPTDASADPARLAAQAGARAFRPGEDDEAWVRANAVIFASLPDQGRLTIADLHERMAEPWFRSDDFLVVARPDGELDAFAWLKITGDGAERDGEVYVLGVRPEAAGRGLGRALMDAALARFADRGCATTSLYVDAANVRAVNLYERLGYAPFRTSIRYRRA